MTLAFAAALSSAQAARAQSIEMEAFYGMCLAIGNDFSRTAAGAVALGYPELSSGDLKSFAPLNPAEETRGWLVDPADLDGGMAALIVTRGFDATEGKFETCTVYFRILSGASLRDEVVSTLNYLGEAYTEDDGMQALTVAEWTPPGMRRTISILFSPTGAEGVVASALTFGQ